MDGILLNGLVEKSCLGIDVAKPGWYKTMCEDPVWREINDCYYPNNIPCRGNRPSQVYMSYLQLRH